MFYLCVHWLVHKSSDFVTIRLQIVMGSPGTSNHLVKNNKSQSRTSESQFKIQRVHKLKMLGPL